MKRLLLVFIVFAIVLSGCQSGEPEAVVGSEPTQPPPTKTEEPTVVPATETALPPTEEPQTAEFAELEQALQAALDAQVEADFPVALLMVDAPDLGFYWKGAAGMADVEGKVLMEPDTPFRISGITNVMMGALVLRLAEEGMLDLDDPISYTLDPAIIEQLNGPDGESYGEAITVRQLLNGTSGNAGYFFADEEDADRNYKSDFTEVISEDPDKIWSPEEIITYTTDNLEPVSAPGKTFVLNDLGYVLLGLVVESVTGEGLDAAYQTWLFEPLSMQQTFMVQAGETRLENVAHVYAMKGLDVSDLASLSWFSGDVVTTVDDLKQFMRAWADGEIFSDPASMEAMTEWVSMADAGFSGLSYGLGVMQFDFNELDRPDIDTIIGYPSIWNGFLFYWPKYNIVYAGTINQFVPLSAYGDLSGQTLMTLLPYVTDE